MIFCSESIIQEWVCHKTDFTLLLLIFYLEIVQLFVQIVDILYVIQADRFKTASVICAAAVFVKVIHDCPCPLDLVCSGCFLTDLRCALQALLFALL